MNVSKLVLAVSVAFALSGMAMGAAAQGPPADVGGDQGPPEDAGQPQGPPEKSELCHVPPEDPDNATTKVLPQPAVDAHLNAHANDTLGACANVTA